MPRTIGPTRILTLFVSLLLGFEAFGDPCVWKVTGSGGSVYVAGSVHMLRADDLPFPQAFITAYEDCDRLYFEAFIDANITPKLQAKTQRPGYLSRDEHLKYFITQYTYNEVEDYLRAQSQTSPNPAYQDLLRRRSSFTKMHPGLLAMTISTLEAEAHGVSPIYGPELYLAERARADGKSMHGLESPFSQMLLLRTLDRSESDRLIRIALKNAHHSSWYFNTLISSWKSGNMAMLAAMVENDYPAQESLSQKLIYRRNHEWLPQIQELLRAPHGFNTMVVVGAAHVVGDESLIRLLADKGYRIEPVY